MKRMALLVTTLLLAGGTAGAMTAEEVANKTGLAGGLCCFPRIAPAERRRVCALTRRVARNSGEWSVVSGQ